MATEPKSLNFESGKQEGTDVESGKQESRKGSDSQPILLRIAYASGRVEFRVAEPGDVIPIDAGSVPVIRHGVYWLRAPGSPPAPKSFPAFLLSLFKPSSPEVNA